MRGRRPKPSRIKALTGNPGKRPLNAHEPRPVPALPECPPELSPAGRQEWGRLTRRTLEAEPGHTPRSWRSRHLLRSLWILGGSFGANPEVRDDGEIADGVSDPVTLPRHRKQAGRADDTHCIRVRLYTRKPQPDIGAAARSASASRSDDG